MFVKQRNQRQGFTLIELLVVISIIAILLALSASATVRVIDVQRGNNTEQTVKIVSEALDRHWQAVVDKARSPSETIHPNVVSACGGDMQTARVVWVKLKLRQQFPMNFIEARTTVLAGIPELAPVSSYVEALRGATPGPQTSESSVCLLLALQQSRSGMTFDADRLGSGAISDANARVDGLKQIVDGHANPLAFYRWPVDNRELNPDPSGTAGHKDPTDPNGLLTTTTFAGTQAAQQWFNGTILHRIPTANPRLPARSFKLIPVVASAGRNGQFGLFPANSTTLSVGNGTMANETRPNLSPPLGTEYLEWHNDNVYSYRLRFGARGD